jgi:hypothetical protein
MIGIIPKQVLYRLIENEKFYKRAAAANGFNSSV